MLKQLAVALAVVSAPLWATNHPEPGRFGVTGEYLYFMPSVDDTYFVLNAASSTAHPSGTRENNDFGYSSGYRVGAVYAFCECDRELLVNWAHLGTSQTHLVSGSHLWDTLGPASFAKIFLNYAGTAESALHLSWSRLDPLLSQRVGDFCCGDFRWLFGLEYTQLKLHEAYQYIQASNTADIGMIRQDSRSFGIGPQIGFEFDYALCCVGMSCLPGRLSLTVLTTASLLSTHSKASEYAATTGGGGTPPGHFSDISDHKTWRVLPALHARLGLNYETTICHKAAALELGYEYNSYYRGLSRISLVDYTGASMTNTNYYNFDVQGLYVSASVSF